MTKMCCRILRVPLLALLTLASSLIDSQAIPEEFLVVTDYNMSQLFEIDLSTGIQRPMISMNLVRPAGVTYDPVEKNVFFINDWKTVIKHSMLMQTEYVYSTLTGNYSYSLYVEPVSRRLYVSEWSAAQIAEYDLTTDTRQVFTNTNGNPWTVVVDLVSRTVYWSQCNPGAVMRADLDNPTRRVVVIQSLSSYHIEALAIDFQEGIMYYASVLPDDGTIESATIDGLNLTTVFRGPKRYYQTFVLNGDYMYIAAHTRSVLKFNRRTGEMTEEPPMNAFMDLDAVTCGNCTTLPIIDATTPPITETTTTTTSRTSVSSPSMCGSLLRESRNDTYVLPGWSIGCYIDRYEDPNLWTIPCRSLLVDLPGYGTADGLLAAGGNFGCYASVYLTSEVSKACADDFQHDFPANYCPPCQLLSVCVRYPV